MSLCKAQKSETKSVYLKPQILIYLEFSHTLLIQD